MKKTWIVVLVAMLFLFLTASQTPLFAPTDPPTRAECEDCRGEWICVERNEKVVKEMYLEDLNTQILNLQFELENVQFELTTAQFRLESTELELESTQLQFEMTQLELRTVESDLEDAQANLLIAYEELDERNAENTILSEKLALCLAQSQGSVKGLWVGANTGIPFGVLGSAGYQFNDRFMVTSAIGYMEGFHWQIGFSTRIREW